MRSDWSCTPKLSAEHPVSASVMRAATGATATITLTGHPWQKVEPLELPVAGLGSRILCKGHNERLSPLDAFMARTVGDIVKRIEVVVQRNDESICDIKFVNGHDIERWMLKVLCGLVCGGSKATIASSPPPPLWLDCILRDGAWPDGWGLYLETSNTKSARAIYAMPIRSRDRVLGLRMELLGLVFWLIATDDLSDVGRAGMPPDASYQPIEIRWWCNRSCVSLLFGWRRPMRGSAHIVEVGSVPRLDGI